MTCGIKGFTCQSVVERENFFLYTGGVLIACGFYAYYLP